MRRQSLEPCLTRGGLLAGKDNIQVLLRGNQRSRSPQDCLSFATLWKWMFGESHWPTFVFRIVILLRTVPIDGTGTTVRDTGTVTGAEMPTVVEDTVMVSL